MLYAVASALAFAVAILNLTLGIEWITVGYGLNPFVSFPLALFFGVLSLNCALIVQADLMLWSHRRHYRR